jgi:hypothetical protein
MADPTASFDEIRGLRAFWARMTQLEPSAESPPLPMRTLLDTLGLGLEQTMAMLGQTRPDWASFVGWIEATAGLPDPARLARYHAWYDGDSAPADELARQRAVMAMAPVFDADDLARWHRDGVVVLRRAITRDQAAAIADYLWSAVGADPADPATWYKRRSNGIMVQHFQHPAMDVPRRSARIAKGFAELYGHADLIVSTDRLSFNPPERPGYTFPGPHLHWDGNLTPPIPFETQAILYLADTAADQGALQVVPGFHHRLADGWIAGLGGADPRTVDLSAEAVTVPAEAGDLVIWRQEIPHGASANRSDRPRLAQYVNHYPMHWPDERGWL